MAVCSASAYWMASSSGWTWPASMPAYAARSKPRCHQSSAAAALTLGELERVLVLGSRLPGVSLRSTLAPGTRAGGSVLVLQAAHTLAGGSWGWDNRLPDSLGPWQGIAQARLNQPLGRGELVYFYGAGDANPARMPPSEPRGEAWVGGGLIVPLGHDGLTLNAELTGSDTRSPGNLFIPATRSLFHRAVLRASYPLVLSRSRELSLAAALEATRQTTRIPAFGVDLNQEPPARAAIRRRRQHGHRRDRAPARRPVAEPRPERLGRAHVG